MPILDNKHDGSAQRGLRGRASLFIIANLLTAVAIAGTLNQPVTANHGVVASAHSLASQAGIEMMRAGGNAVDAAVAAAFAIGVVEPHASGIGGEGVMLIYRAEKREIVVVDYKSTAPIKASFSGPIPASGYTAIATPGTVAGLALALERYGTMALAQVLAPSIRFAEEGFVASPTLAGIVNEHFEGLQNNPVLAAVFCPDGLPLETGATVKNPALAGSLRRIAAEGAQVFYHGEIAQIITKEITANGGFLSLEDLASYRPVVRHAVCGKYRGYTVYSAPPPVGGTPVIEILQILDRFRLNNHPPLAPENVHLIAEAMKRGFADYSAFIADPDMIRVPLTWLLSTRYAKKRSKEIDPQKATTRILAGQPPEHVSPSTTSLATVDRQGNMVTLTQTISDYFGADVMIAGTGIILNNEMRNFSTRGVNVIAPGKRMRTTIAPTIVLRRGKPFAVLGTPGGARITSTMTTLISNLLDYRMGIQEAIEAPRFFARDREKDLFVEDRFPQTTLNSLANLGYTFQVMKDYDSFFGGAQGIVIDPKSGKRIGGADPRRDGAVLGY